MDISGFTDTMDLSNAQWVGNIPFVGFDGVELMVRSPNYKQFVRARDAAMRAMAMRDDDTTDAWLVTAGEMARHLLVDWKGIVIDGKEAEFDADLAFKLMTADDPHGIGERMRKALDYACSSVAVDILVNREKISGNSPAP